jgi:hypothetical protein
VVDADSGTQRDGELLATQTIQTQLVMSLMLTKRCPVARFRRSAVSHPVWTDVAGDAVHFSEDKGMSKEHEKGAEKVTFTIVVNGTPTEVEQNVNSPLKAVIARALEATDNVGQPPENWELRDDQGVLLERDRKIGSYGFTGAVTLFLSLKAGVGGAC